MMRDKGNDERIEDTPPETAALSPSLSLVATGLIARTRQHARQEMEQRQVQATLSPRLTPRRRGNKKPDANRLKMAGEKGQAEELFDGLDVDVDTAFNLSPRYADETTLQELQRRPTIDLTVRDARAQPPQTLGKESEASCADHVQPTPPPTAATAPSSSTSHDTAKRQSWFSRVHVPLAHRKLVQSPQIFDGIVPAKPMAARSSSGGAHSQQLTPARNNRVPRVALLSSSPRDTVSNNSNNHSAGGVNSKRRGTVDRQFLERLRERNQELYDKLVTRFHATRRLENSDSPATVTEEQTTVSATTSGPRARARPRGAGGGGKHRGDHLEDDDQDMLSGITSVEDAVLFFLHEKHAHDILYFKRRSSDAPGGSNQRRPSGAAVSGGAAGGSILSLGSVAVASSSSSATSRFMPYDLERVAASPEPGAGDFYIMSSSALVHHSNSSDHNQEETLGEAIPIAQWVMESKMFSLLLAGIPLFQKFLVRKVFKWWALETKHLIFVAVKKKLSKNLPFARKAFAKPMLLSFQALRRVQQIQALTLPVKHTTAAVNLVALHDHHRQRLSDAETWLIDAKEELLSLMDTMVHEIQLNTDPSTQLDLLYSVEASTIHAFNPKWKTAPLRALRHRKESLALQVETAQMDLLLLPKYVKLMEYMFTESVYLMILGGIAHLAKDLCSDDHHGAISASVAIVGDELILSPSVLEMKNVLLEGIARLIRLAGNFHFTKNAITWSTNRGTGSLAIVASSFLSSDTTTSTTQFDLQEVLRKDPAFKQVSTGLILEVSSCFDEAAHQMKAFESLKPIYAAVQSVSRAETLKNLQLVHHAHAQASSSTAAAEATATGPPTASAVVRELPSVVGISGMEVSRYLRTLSHRLAVLDKSQHACQKIQSSWKVGFLEIQCRRSVTEILERITQERDMLHQHVFQLAAQGANGCLQEIQKASLIVEDRPQLIEFFCEQLKQVKQLKESEKQLHQDIRNVDEIVRALKRFAPQLMTETSVQANLLHAMYGKYELLTQSHDKFVSKMLPNITQQVSSALQKYSVRCGKLLKLYEENCGISSEEELDKNVDLFQDFAKEIKAIEEATHLYQEYQRMVGMKVMEIYMLAEAKTRWAQVEQVVLFMIQWKTATKSMENGIFSDQPWKTHLEKVSSFATRLQSMMMMMMQQQQPQQSQDQYDKPTLKNLFFASKLLDKMKTQINDYQRRLELVMEMAQPFVKPHHWQQILALLDIVNYVSSSGVMLSDGSTLTLGFLQTRSLWKFENAIREITKRAKNDAATEQKMDEMKNKMYAAVVPIIKMDDGVFEMETSGALRLLTQFENDLLTVQMLAQLTSTTQLSSNLALWAEEISSYQEILDAWISVQADWKKLSLIFGHHDVQQIVVDATYEFQALDRKWRAVMAAAKGASSLAVCLREVMSRAFLYNCTVASEKLWKELGNYLFDKRHFFPRLQFVSDRDLLHIIASSKHPMRLCRLISKCFREIHSLKIVRVDTASRRSQGQRQLGSSIVTAVTHETSTAFAAAPAAGGDDEQKPQQQEQDDDVTPPPLPLDEDQLVQLFDIQGIVGHCRAEELVIKPLRVSSSPEIWMKELSNRIQEAVKDAICHAMDGPLPGIYENHFADLNKPQYQHHHHPSLSSSWLTPPLHVLVLCVNVLLTNELTSLVFADRNGPDWASFWDGFTIKKQHLATFVRCPTLTSRERIVASNLLVLLLNKATGIDDLYRENGSASGGGQPMEAAPASVPLHHQDTTAIHYNYAHGHSFAWTKMMRFYYEPFDKKCIIHQSVKSYEYGNAFLGGYTVPMVTPLCDRVLLAMNLALALEVGAIVHSCTKTQSVGKRTLVNELASSVGCELLPVDWSAAIGFTQFHRVLLGALQTECCWVTLVGIECSGEMAMIRVMAREIGRLRDVLHGSQDVFSLDGVSVNVSSSKMGLFICASLDLRGGGGHQELMLRLSQVFMPVVCPPPEMARIAELSFLVNGLCDGAVLSRKLTALSQLMRYTPVPCMHTPMSVKQLLLVIAHAAARHRANPYKSEEKCLILSLWEELGANVIPEQRVSVVKLVRSLFASAEALELNQLGLLAARTNTLSTTHEEQEVQEDQETKKPITQQDQQHDHDQMGYDSDDDDQLLQTLIQFKDHARHVMENVKHLVPTDQYIRKLFDLFQVVSRNVLTVLVGQSGCGKTTALDILSAVFMSHHQATTSHEEIPMALTIIENHIKLVRLFPSAFSFKEIYGYFREDTSWCDGFLSKFIQHECEEAALHNQMRVVQPTAAGAGHSRRGRRASLGGLQGKPSRAHVPWLVLDGLSDSSIMDPLKDFTSSDPATMKVVQLPNGDQLHCENALLRVFCEVSDLEQWSPGTLSRCGVMYFQSDLVPYTVLVKSWVTRQAHSKPKHATVAVHLAKLARSMLPPLLEITKRHKKPFLELLVPHLVSNFLQLLTWFLDQMGSELATWTPCNEQQEGDSSSTTNSSSEDRRRSLQPKIVVSYAAMMSLGLAIQGKGRVEFHEAVLTLVPELTTAMGGGNDLFTTGGRTIYDIRLTFESGKIELSLFEAPLPSLMDGYASWHSHGARRQSAFRRLSNSSLEGQSNGGITGLGTSSTLFIPTPRLLGYRDWMATMLAAKLNVIVTGDSAIGKTRLLEDVLTELIKGESHRFDTKCVQIHGAVTSDDILNAVESGLPRKMRGLYCPSAGKKGLAVVIENLNLERTTMEAATTQGGARGGARGGGESIRGCSEMIRQVCDAKGSFVKSSKEFVEFRDVLLAISFSLSSFGYPKLEARFLRHFQVICMSDPTRDIFKTVLATFPEQLMQRLEPLHSTPTTKVTHAFQTSDIAKLCRFPMELFHGVRKHLKPTQQSPHLLLSLNDVLRCLMRVMNVSVKSTETLCDLELYTVFTTYQLFRSRMLTAMELTTLEAVAMDAASRLGLAASSRDVFKKPFDFLYADYGDNEGCVRITSRAAVALFAAADERFQWYNRVMSKDAASDPSPQQQQQQQHQQAPASMAASAPLPHAQKSRDEATKLAENKDGTSFQVTSTPTTATTSSSPRRNSIMYNLKNLHTTKNHNSGDGVEKSTASSPAMVQDMLDVLSFLESNVQHLLFCGAEPSKRRSATMVACGAQAFHFREVSSQLKFPEYIDQLKAPILEAGLKAAHTLIYVDCDSLSTQELHVLLHLMMQSDLPHHLYSSSDKAKILAQEHQLRTFQQTHLKRPSVSSFFDDLTSVTSTRDGMMALHDGGGGPGSSSSSGSPRKETPGAAGGAEDLVPSSSPSSSSSQQRKSVYRDNLRRCLHIVLSFGQSKTMFELVSSHPTLYYHASVKTFRCFDHDSLHAVYNDWLASVPPLQDALAHATVSSDARHDLQSLVVAVHDEGMKLLQAKENHDEFAHHHEVFTKTRSEEFLHVLKIVFVFQKCKLQELHDSLQVGIRVLERDAKEASDQLEKNADGKLQLVDAANAVVQSQASLHEYEAKDKDARRAFILDEQRCGVLQSEIEHERDVIQQELNKTLPDVARATEALSQINKSHITEMKSFVNPPQLVRLAMQAVCVLLGVAPTWTEALRILADIHFLERLRQFDKDKVDAFLIDRVKLYVNHPDFSMENMKRASTASTTLCKWVLAIVKYFEVMKKVAPTKQKLSVTEIQFHEIDEMVRLERQKLIDLELSLNELRAQHTQNVARESELQRNYESKTRWKQEVVAFQKVVEKLLFVLQKRLLRVETQQFTLVGDCTVVAAAAVYASAVPHTQRRQAVSKWRHLALTHLQGKPSWTSGDGVTTPSVSMPHDSSFLQNWFISGKTLKKEFEWAILGMQLVPKQTPLVVAMLLMDQMQKISGKYPLLIDPLGRATSWLKQRGHAMKYVPHALLLQEMEASSGSTNSGGSTTKEMGEENDVTVAASTAASGDPPQPQTQEHEEDHHHGQGHGHGRLQARHAITFAFLHGFNILTIDACDANAVTQVEKCIAHKNPLLILIDHVSECEESAFHGLLDVVAIAKKKGGHTVIFSTCALDTMHSWKPKVWGQLSVVDCTPTPDEMDDHLLSSLVRHHAPALEKEYESSCRDFVAEKAKEEQIVRGFLELMHKISEERDAIAQSHAAAATAAATVSSPFAVTSIVAATFAVDENSTSSSSANRIATPSTTITTTGLQDHEMSRTTRCLAEYMAVKTKRKQAKRHALDLRAKRALFDGFATRMRAFFFAERQFFQRRRGDVAVASLEWDLASMVLQIEDCVHDWIAVGLPSSRPQDNGLTVAAHMQGSHAMGDMVDCVTQQLLKRRLVGLPSVFHRTYRFLVAVGVALNEDKQHGDEMDDAWVQQILSSPTTRGVHWSRGNRKPGGPSSPTTTTGQSGASTGSNPVRRVATETVRVAMATALHRRASANSTGPETSEQEELLLIAISSSELRDLYSRVDQWFLSAVYINKQQRLQERRQSLAHDLTIHGDMWLLFAQNPSLGVYPNDDVDENEQTQDEEENSSSTTTDEVSLPPWIKEQSVLARFVLCLTVFGVTSVEMVDAVVAHYLPRDTSALHVAKNLVATEHELAGEIVSGGNVIISNNGNGSSVRPIVVHFNPRSQISTPFSSILQCARLVGVRDESVSFISKRFQGDSEVSHKLRQLKELSASGGWIVLEDMASARQSTRNVLRVQVHALQVEASGPTSRTTQGKHTVSAVVAQVSRPDFRLWILETIPMATVGSNRLPTRLGVLCTHFFLEFPSGLRQFYQAAVLDETVRKQQFDRQQLHLHSSGGATNAFSAKKSNGVAVQGIARQSSSSLVVPPDQLWVQSALWIFHALFRQQIACGISDLPTNGVATSRSSSSNLPRDLVASQYELERAMRVIQLHQRQRTLASTMAAISGMSGPSFSSSTSASITEWTALYELASEVYASKAFHAALVPLCRDLMATCLALPHHHQQTSATSSGHGHTSGWARASEWQLRVLAMRDLISQHGDAALSFSPSVDVDEASLMPHSLRWQCRAAEWDVVMASPSTDQKAPLAVGQSLGELTSAAQAVVKQLIPQLPPKDCLALGVQRQEHERRRSVITAWRKNRPTMSSGDSAGPITFRRHQLLHWEQTMQEHVLQVELPALETYVRYVWSLLEHVLALKAHRVTSTAASPAVLDDLTEMLHALWCHKVPHAWLTVGGSNSNSSTPSRLNVASFAPPRTLTHWVKWLQNGVAFYQSVTTQGRIPDPLVLPALQYPKAYLFTLRQSLATERGISPDDLSFVVANPTGQDPTASNSRDTEHAIVASFQVSGLVLWNARWSHELHALQESVTTTSLTPSRSTVPSPSVMDPMPVLTIQVTTRYPSVVTSRPRALADELAHPFLYRCPVFASATSRMRLEDPIAFLFTPTIDRAGVMASCGAALFVEDDVGEVAFV